MERDSKVFADVAAVDFLREVAPIVSDHQQPEVTTGKSATTAAAEAEADAGAAAVPPPAVPGLTQITNKGIEPAAPQWQAAWDTTVTALQADLDAYHEAGNVDSILVYLCVVPVCPTTRTMHCAGSNST